MKSSWNRGCRHGKTIDVVFHLLEFFLVFNTKALFLINNHKTQLFEYNILLYDSVGSNEDINFAGGNLSKNLFLFCRSNKARKSFNLYREVLKTALAGFVMLFCKNCSRGQEGYLFSAHYSLKSCSHGNFRLSITNIATNQAVHRNRLFHISLYFFGNCYLIGSIFVRESGFKSSLPFSLFRESKTNWSLAARIQINKLLGDIFNSLFNFIFTVFPGFASNAVQARFITFVSDIALNKIYLFDWNKSKIIVGILKLDIITLVAHGLYTFNSVEKSDSPVYMNNIIARIKLNKGVYSLWFSLVYWFCNILAAAENLIFLNYKQLWIRQSETRRYSLWNEDYRMYGTIISNISIVLKNLVNTELLVFIISKNKDIPAGILQLRQLLLHKIDVSKERTGRFCRNLVMSGRIRVILLLKCSKKYTLWDVF